MRTSNYTFLKLENYLYSKPVKGLKGYGVSYRFGFNGQEKDDEVSGTGNTMTAEYWEYDSRLGRRWNLDPKPYFGLSEYACLGNNPLLFIDPNGDIFGVGKTKDGKLNEKAKNDVKNLAVNPFNQKYIKFNEKDGTVSLDFGKDMTKELREKIINDDKGIKLISDLINAKKIENGVIKDVLTIYEEGDQSSGIDGNGKTITEKWNPLNPQTAISNFSVNEKFANSGIMNFSDNELKSYTAKPIQGDGLVRISPGKFTDLKCGLQINRSSIVYHELRENFARTVMKLPYRFVSDDYLYGENNRVNGKGAHVYSALEEGSSYGNPFPGARGFQHE